MVPKLEQWQVWGMDGWMDKGAILPRATCKPWHQGAIPHRSPGEAKLLTLSKNSKWLGSWDSPLQKPY